MGGRQVLAGRELILLMRASVGISIRLKYTVGMSIRESSATGTEAETDLAASQTEAKTEKRTGAGRE